MPAPLKALTPEASARHHFGFEVRRHRQAAGMTHAGLGHRVHLDQSTISRIECAKRYPSRTFATMCDQIFKTGNYFAKLHDAVLAERPKQTRRHAGIG